MSSLMINNADCVNEGRRFDADILVREGRIEAIGPDLQSRVIMTLVNGEVAFESGDQGARVNDQVRGRRLRFRGVR